MVESSNSAIFYGKGGDIATNRREELEMSVLCLRILQAALVYINTLMLQDVLAEPEWAELLKPPDRRGLTPLFWQHVQPHGEVRLDVAKRLPLGGAAEAAAQAVREGIPQQPSDRACIGPVHGGVGQETAGRPGAWSLDRGLRGSGVWRTWPRKTSPVGRRAGARPRWAGNERRDASHPGRRAVVSGAGGTNRLMGSRLSGRGRRRPPVPAGGRCSRG